MGKINVSRFVLLLGIAILLLIRQMKTISSKHQLRISCWLHWGNIILTSLGEIVPHRRDINWRPRVDFIGEENTISSRGNQDTFFNIESDYCTNFSGEKVWNLMGITTWRVKKANITTRFQNYGDFKSNPALGKRKPKNLITISTLLK